MSDRPNITGQIAALKAAQTKLRKQLQDQNEELQSLRQEQERAAVDLATLKQQMAELVDFAHQAAQLIQQLRDGQGGGLATQQDIDQIGQQANEAADQLYGALNQPQQQPQGQQQPAAAPQMTQAPRRPQTGQQTGQQQPQGQQGPLRGQARILAEERDRQARQQRQQPQGQNQGDNG